MEEPADKPGLAGSRGRAADAVPFAVAVAAAGALSFLSGGYIIASSTPVVVVLLCAAAAWMWLLRRRGLPAPLFLAALVMFGLFALWTALSVLWSYGPDLTWVAFNLTALYLAVVAVLGFTEARALQLRIVAWGSVAALTAVGVYSFLTKALPGATHHLWDGARLASPVGYWNVLALLMVLGLCLAVAVAGDPRTHAAVRTLAAGAAVPMACTFFFTFSRGGWLALGVALILFFAFTTTRLSSFVTLVIVAAPVAAALWHLRDLSTLFMTTGTAALKEAEGETLLRFVVAALAVTVVAQVVVALVQRRVRLPGWSRTAAGAVVVAVVAVLLVGGSTQVVRAHGGTGWVTGKIHALLTDSAVGTAGYAGNSSSRLSSVSTGRPELWHEALRQWRVVRVAGTGAGTFRFTHYRYRTTGGVVKAAHSEWFNLLSELGMTGLVLFVVALALLVAAAVGNPLAHRRDPLHPLLVALQAGVAAFIVHISWDWDWDMAAIGLLVFVFVAVCVAYRMTRAADERRAAADEAPPAEARRRPSAVRWGLRAVASAALVLLALSWLPPYLSFRAQNAALGDAGEGRLTTALASARRAATLDPLAASPLITEAQVLEQQGRYPAALATLRSAARLQPQDFEVWYALGELQQGALGRAGAARASFSRALGLNPLDGASRAELDRLGS